MTNKIVLVFFSLILATSERKEVVKRVKTFTKEGDKVDVIIEDTEETDRWLLSDEKC